MNAIHSSGSAIPDSAAEDLQQQMKALIKLLSTLQFYVVCMFSILLWDYLVTLRAEIVFVWPSRWNPVKACFFINRYLTLATMVFLMLCAFWEGMIAVCPKVHYPQAYIPILVFLCCNFKLAHRCSALFARPRPVFSSLVGLTVVQAIVQAAVSVKNQAIVAPPGYAGCYSFPGVENEAYGFVYWLMPLLTYIITLLITVYKVLQYWAQHGRTHLLDIFLQDGIQDFLVVTSANIVNVVYMKSKVTVEGVTMQGGNLNAAMALVITSMMVSRLIIHMKLALSDTSYETAYQQTEVSIVKRSLIPSALGVLLPSMPHKAATSRSPWSTTNHGVHTVVDIDLAHLPKCGSSGGRGGGGKGSYEVDKKYAEATESIELQENEKPISENPCVGEASWGAVTPLQSRERPGTAPAFSSLASSPPSSSPAASAGVVTNGPQSLREQSTFSRRVVLTGLGVEDEAAPHHDRDNAAGGVAEAGGRTWPITRTGRHLAAGVNIKIERVVKVEADERK